MTQCTRCGTTELRQSCPKCDDLSHLQKLVEEQKGEIAELKLIAYGVDEGIGQWQEHIRGLEFVIMQRDAEIKLRMSQLAEQKQTSDKLESELELYKHKFAEQTESVRRLTEALEYIDRKLGSALLAEGVTPSWASWCSDTIKQALNQERLGDGGKDKPSPLNNPTEKEG